MKLRQRERPAPDRSVESDTWGLAPGEQIRPGLKAMSLLGGGRLFEAYLAHDGRRMCLVVAKLLRPGRLDRSSVECLRREFEALKRLDHPVIARGFDACFDGSQPHLTLEHLEGPRLSTLLRRYGPLPMDQLLPLALQLGSALHYMHEVGMLHLDVKPKNIIMSGPPRLIDLSIARTLEGAAGLDGPTGTTGYMAPEQEDPRGPVKVGTGADSWGLGVTLFEAATGRLPIPSERPRLGRTGRGPELPAQFQEVVSRCLAADPAERPRPGEAVLALEPLVAALPRRFPLSPPRPGSYGGRG